MSTLKLLTRPLLLTTALLLALALSLAGIATIARADGPGDLDPSFRGTGVVTTCVGVLNIGEGIALQPDGKIIAAGLSEPDYTDTDFTVLRYNSDGSLDTSFNGTGIVTTNINTGYDWPFDVALQPDQKILAVGFTSSDSYSSNSTLAIVRYNPDGSLDRTFKSTGILTDPLQNLYGAYAVVIQADGKIVVTGKGNCSDCIPVARYLPNGNLDQTFGSGIVMTPLLSQPGTGTSLALQPDGKIVVAGTSSTSGQPSVEHSLVIIRYNPDGSLDNTFYETGYVIASFTDGAMDMVVQPDGRILAVGWNHMVRFHPDGHLDHSFNQIGIITDTRLDFFAIALQPGSKIVATGGKYDQGFMIARFLSDGSPDLTFNQTGLVMIEEASQGYDLAIQPDGKIVAGGSDQNGCFAVVRILGDRYQHFPLIVKSSGLR